MCGACDPTTALVGMEPVEEQQRQDLRGAGADGDVGPVDRTWLAWRNGASLEQALQLDALHWL